MINSLGNFYIGLYTNSGTTNRFRVTIDLSSRYTKGGNPVTAASCIVESFPEASNQVTSSTIFTFDLDTSSIISSKVKLKCDDEDSSEFYIYVINFCSNEYTSPATISETVSTTSTTTGSFSMSTYITSNCTLSLSSCSVKQYSSASSC